MGLKYYYQKIIYKFKSYLLKLFATLFFLRLFSKNPLNWPIQSDPCLILTPLWLLFLLFFDLNSFDKNQISLSVYSLIFYWVFPVHMKPRQPFYNPPYSKNKVPIFDCMSNDMFANLHILKNQGIEGKFDIFIKGQ